MQVSSAVNEIISREVKVMAEKLEPSREISSIVENQMRQWEQSKNAKSAQLSGGVPIDYIAISRQEGSNGEEVARILADLMEWPLYDKAVLDYLVQDTNIQQRISKYVDAKTQAGIDNRLESIFPSKSSHSSSTMRYYRLLSKFLMVLSTMGRAIFIGRGAALILPRELGLSVRITAPLDLRCQRYAPQHDISPAKAKSELKKSDHHQEHFVKEFTGKDINDARHYDFMYSTEKLSPTSVAKLIWRAFDLRVESLQPKARPDNEADK
jgi:hypothetical protein